MPYGITLKKLLDQHDAFDARERRKAEKAAEKERRRLRYLAQQEVERRCREAKERENDLRQQAMLDDYMARRMGQPRPE